MTRTHSEDGTVSPKEDKQVVEVNIHTIVLILDHSQLGSLHAPVDVGIAVLPASLDLC